MPTYRQILDQHRTLLLIDSASAQVQVALLRHDQPPLWHTADGEAGEHVFSGTAAVLDRAALPLDAINAFLYCDGPGSVLGIRTAASALRTWHVLRPRPVFSYGSLALVAHALALDGHRHLSVVADARRDTWHRVTVGPDGAVSPLQRVPAAALSGALHTPAGFRRWSEPPAPLLPAPYALAALLPRLADIELFDPAPAPDAFLHEEPAYQTWTPRVHRAPA